MIVADASVLHLSGNGDVIEPEDGIAHPAPAVLRRWQPHGPLVVHTDLDSRKIVEAAMQIRRDICIYTNRRSR